MNINKFKNFEKLTFLFLFINTYCKIKSFIICVCSINLYSVCIFPNPLYNKALLSILGWFRIYSSQILKACNLSKANLTRKFKFLQINMESVGNSKSNSKHLLKFSVNLNYGVDTTKLTHFNISFFVLLLKRNPIVSFIF